MPRETPHGKAGLELREVSKFFGDLEALKKIRLRIEPGDSLLLYGPNGAGKTTLLRVLATLSRPSEGQVLFGGEDIYRNPARTKAAIGFVSHATFLYGELTAFENLEFVGTLFRLGNLEKKVREVLDRFGLSGRAKVPVRELSRGFQQRVSLARAFFTIRTSSCSMSLLRASTPRPRKTWRACCGSCPSKARRSFFRPMTSSKAPRSPSGSSFSKKARCGTTGT